MASCAAIFRQHKPRIITTLLLFTSLFASTAFAETTKGTASPEQLELIAHATELELHALEDPTPYQFQQRLEWNWGNETRSVIETPEGRADRVILFRDEPLTPEQQEKQQHRLQKLLSDGAAVKGEMQDQKAETQRRIRMVRAFTLILRGAKKVCCISLFVPIRNSLRKTAKPRCTAAWKDHFGSIRPRNALCRFKASW
jgi:hypothetical protein